MKISFVFEEGIQIVNLDGLLNETDAAAVRSRLGEKLNSGRKEIVLDLSKTDLHGHGASGLMRQLIDFSLVQGADIAISGILPSKRHLLWISGNPRVSFFTMKDEAIYYLQQRVKASQNPPAAATQEVKELDEDQIKKKEIHKLLEQYLPHQLDDLDDPYRIEFFLKRYEEAPFQRALEHETFVNEELKKFEIQRDQLDRNNEQLASQIKRMLAIRKQAVSEDELKDQISTLNQEEKNLKKQAQDFKTNIKKIEVDIAKAKKDVENITAEVAKEAKNMEKELEKATKEVEKLKAELSSLP